MNGYVVRSHFGSSMWPVVTSAHLAFFAPGECDAQLHPKPRSSFTSWPSGWLSSSFAHFGLSPFGV